MALHPRTADQRSAALEKAIAARRERADVGKRLKSGSISLSEVLASGQTNDIIGGMKVSAVLKSLPGVGEVRTRQIMERIGITESRRVRGLGARQREALARWSEERDVAHNAHEAPADDYPAEADVVEWDIRVPEQAAPEGAWDVGNAEAAPNIEDWDRP